MEKILITISLLSLSIFGYAQSKPERLPRPPVRLSKQQMYADYDQFVNIIKTYNAQWEIRKENTDYDLFDILQKRRNMIDSIQNYWEFINFLDNSLFYLLDNHVGRTYCYYKVKESRFAPGQKFYKSKRISRISDGLKKYLLIKGTTDTVSPFYHTTASYYIQGEYYMLNSSVFIKRDESDSICFRNARVISCDNMPVDEYVNNKMIGFLSPLHIRWDFDRKKYYTDQLLIDYAKPLRIEDESGIVYDFIPDHYSIKRETTSDKYAAAHIHEIYQNYKQRELQFARYFENKKILYVYLEIMSYQNDYNIIDSVKKIGKGKPIEKIVIDVRGNRGGGDGFWMDLLSAIVKDTITFYDRVALNANEQTIHFFKSEYPKEMVDEYEYLEIPFLEGKNMFVHTQLSTIDPQKESLGYSGPIFILQDENTFSSGHSFSSFATHSDQLISVGVPTGNMVGFGFNPWHFQLNNSLFTFHFEPAIDLSHAKKWEDTFQCTPEIVVWPTVEEIVDYKSYHYLLDTETFLFTKDYLFNKVLDIEF